MVGSVIVPLYVYPFGGAWDSVYDMCVAATSANKATYSSGADRNRATSHPQVQFTAIINVHDGPGYGALPEPDYSHAITTLNSFNNVRTVGYVATTWCERELSSVLDDVAAYSFWGEYQDSLAIDGIFVDETPTQYSPGFDSYLQTIAQAVHTSDGLKDGYIGKVTFSSRHWCVMRVARKLDPLDPCCSSACCCTGHMSDPELLSHDAWYWYPVLRQLHAHKADIVSQFTIQARYLIRSSSKNRFLNMAAPSDLT
jgi:hypothetical protein